MSEKERVPIVYFLELNRIEGEYQFILICPTFILKNVNVVLINYYWQNPVVCKLETIRACKDINKTIVNFLGNI